MQWMLTGLLAIVLLSLALGTAAEQREGLQTTSTPSIIFDWLNKVIGSPLKPSPPSSDKEAVDCSLIFDSLGPFCQYVISETDSETCQRGFSVDTCNNCLDMVQLCGSLDSDSESICLSDLAPSCAVTTELDPFIMDYCSIIQSVCNEQSSEELSSSGSGSARESASGSGTLSGSGSGGSGLSGSGSGSSGDGSGVEPTIIPTTGSPGATSPTTNPESTSPATLISSTTVATTPTNSGGMDMTTTETVTVPPFTTVIVPPVLVSPEDLTELQRENIVIVGFTGLNDVQFLSDVITVFREKVATMVNELLLNQGQNRKKRQAPPVPLSPGDVIVINPLRMADDELLVSFVVGGQGGQREPVSGTVVANLLQDEGSNLAMALTNTSGQSVQFVEAFASTTTTTTESALVTSETTTADVPTTRALPPPSSEEREPLQQQLSSGAIAGIVIAVSAVVLLLGLVIVAAVAVIVGYRMQSGKMKLNVGAKPHSFSHHSNIVVTKMDVPNLTSDWQPMSASNIYADVPTTGGNRSTDEYTKL